MIPYEYGYGFEPNDYPQIDLQIDFKQLKNSCKALVKKAGRKLRKR